MRLIDADEMLANESEAYMNAQLEVNEVTALVNSVVHQKIQQLIIDTPTIEAEPVKHGRWIVLDECLNEGVYCSVCHKKVYRVNYRNCKMMSRYCPNCGAKMDSEGAEIK